ncbi:MAG TPA: hypothetical protein DCY85_03770 [Firmicutes bacterium]|nr:hypothetical protein [Bacillota bacterium]HBG44626.1 hypothetical protein [Bacillota bacterium]HBL48942.1 hypothetical protein [Bacillota bacterium]HBL68168.1 hypothetical protein [Bacillota bacterium]HCF90202.1 hypothetical protein [Bacillota bacterium]
MKKNTKLIVAIAVALLLVAMAIPAVAAVTNALKPEQKKELESIYNQIIDLQKKAVDKRVEFGQVDKTTGEYMKDRMELRRKYMDQWIENAGPGMGMGLGGARKGAGAGMHGVGGGKTGQPNCSSCPLQQQNQPQQP